MINAVLKLLPPGPRSDRIANYLRFVVRHRRRPTRNLHLNDVLFAIKTSGELADPLRVFTTDKELAKLFLACVVAPELIVPTLAVLRSRDEVDDFRFPDNCIAKPTHSSGKVQRIASGAAADREMIRGWFCDDHYRKRREENYRTLRKKVIVEPLLYTPDTLQEIKFYSHSGKVNGCFLRVVEQNEVDFFFFDRQWSGISYRTSRTSEIENIARPACLAEMIAVAEAIGKFFGFVRIDFLTDGTTFFVGEITHCEGSANYRFHSSRDPDLVSEELVSKIIFR